MNAVGYDAAAIGSHELNYGVAVKRGERGRGAERGRCRGAFLVLQLSFG